MIIYGLGILTLYYTIELINSFFTLKRMLVPLKIKTETFSRMLNDVSSLLISEGIKWWLDFGTLLGYYRENTFIEHDFDIDLAVVYPEYNLVSQCLKKLDKTKYIIHNINIFGIIIHHVIIDKKTSLNIDINYYKNINDTYERCVPFFVSSGKKYNTDILFPLNNGIMEGTNIFYPNKSDKVLEYLYGNDFMIPKYTMNPLKNIGRIIIILTVLIIVIIVLKYK